MLFDTITYITGADHNYDLSGSTLQTPSDGSTIMRMTAVRAFLLPQNLAGSAIDAQTGPSSAAGSPLSTLAVDLRVNGVSQGIFLFTGVVGSPIPALSKLMSAADSITGNLASGDVSIAVGDIVELVLNTVASSDSISITVKTLAA